MEERWILLTVNFEYIDMFTCSFLLLFLRCVVSFIPTFVMLGASQGCSSVLSVMLVVANGASSC